MKMPALIVIVMGTGLLIAVADSQDDAGVSRKARQEESAKKAAEAQKKREADALKVQATHDKSVSDERTARDKKDAEVAARSPRHDAS